MRKILFLILTVSLSLTNWAASSNGDPLLGRWSYKAMNAPYEFERGQVEFMQDDDHLSAVVYTNGTKIKIYSVDKRDGRYTCNLYIDNTLVELTLLQVEGGTLEGRAFADNTAMDIVFTRTTK